MARLRYLLVLALYKPNLGCFLLLKYGFYKKSERCNSDQVPFCGEKSVQLVRVASFRRDFLQNRYFSDWFIPDSFAQTAFLWA